MSGSNNSISQFDVSALKQRPANILFVDDETNILSSLKRLFKPQGYRIFLASSAIDGLKILKQERIDVVVSDMRMPKMSGSDFLAEVRRCWADTIRILLTGYDDAGPIIQAVNSGEIFRYVYKPWNDGELELAVKEGLSRRYAEEERKRLVDLLHTQNMELSNKTSALQKALEEIETLKGIIPICSYCHQIRDDEGLWSQLELYLSKHSLADFSHGVCPDCYEKEIDKIMSSNKSM